MSFILRVLAMLLMLLPLAPAVADESADNCVEMEPLRSRSEFRQARLRNTCSYPINVMVCCVGQGRLANCQSNDFEELHIEARRSKSVPSCDGWAIFGACKAPYRLDQFYWDGVIGTVRGGPCVAK